MRDLAAIQEAVLVEYEVNKGDAGHPTVTGRADLLRADIWDRWRAGEGLPPVTTPLSDAIGKLAEVADRQLTLLQQSTTIHQPATIHRLVADPVDRSVVQARRDPSAEAPEQAEVNVGPSPLFSTSSSFSHEWLYFGLPPGPLACESVSMPFHFARSSPVFASKTWFHRPGAKPASSSL